MPSQQEDQVAGLSLSAFAAGRLTEVGVPQRILCSIRPCLCRAGATRPLPATPGIAQAFPLCAVALPQLC